MEERNLLRVSLPVEVFLRLEEAISGLQFILVLAEVILNGLLSTGLIFSITIRVYSFLVGIYRPVVSSQSSLLRRWR
jgi:hypothetical protein